MTDFIGRTIIMICLLALFGLLCVAISSHMSAVAGLVGLVLGASAARATA